MNEIDKYTIELLEFLGKNYEETGKTESFEGDTILRSLKISPENLNDAVQILYDQGLLKRNNYKAAAFIFGQIGLNTYGKKAYFDMKAKDTMQEMKVFISHSSADIDIVKLIIKLLRISLNLHPKEILCTSIEGHKLDPGVNTDERLKKEVHDAKSFIGIIT